jgi:hypothetical protein
MSGWGQTLPKETIPATSAFPPLATGQRTCLMVRFVPQGDSSTAANTAAIRSTSSVRASSAHSSLGANFCNPIKTDETRFIHLMADCLNLRELDFSCVSQMIASNFRDQGDVHNHSCRKRLDR